MSFNPLSVFKTVDKITDIVGKAVTDKDRLNEINGHLAELKEQSYLAELQVTTIPWVDALHKMGRQILAVLNLLVPALLVYFKPDVDPLVIGAMVGPSGIYNYIKGKGK